MRKLMLTCFLLSFVFGCSQVPDAGEPPAPVGSFSELVSPSALAGGAIRVVWIREVGDGTDWHAATSNVVLMGYDSEDGRGERVLHEGFRNYNKPLLSPDGQTVVFTDLSDRKGNIMMLGWGGSSLIPLGPGLALDMWEDPSGKVWVYSGRGPMDNRGNVSGVDRFPLDNPSAREVVWDHAVARDNFQLGASGEFAGGLFPAAQNGGLVNLDTKEFNVYAGGCWASLSPDNRGLVWVFDGRHRNLQFYATDAKFQPEGAGDRWIVNITGAPGIDGGRTYYPRWSNHSRFFGVSGPMPHGNYERAEIYVGRFSEDYQSVEAWSRITSDDRPDLFPDVAVFPGRMQASVEGIPAESSGDQGREQETEVFNTTGVLLEKTQPRSEDLGTYTSAFAVYRYRVDALPRTGKPGKLIVAHKVIEDSKVIRGFRRSVGESYDLSLEIYDGNPKFQGPKVFSDLSEGAETLYVDVSN